MNGLIIEAVRLHVAALTQIRQVLILYFPLV